MRTRRTACALAIAVAGSLVTAPASQATFPGGDGLIAFSYESPVPGEHLTQTDVYTMEPGGTGITQLTSTPHRNEFAPAWNADGTRIAFWRTKAPFGGGTIWVMDADGTDPMRLTSEIDARDPVWSPNGRRIAFSAWTKTGSTSIYTMRAADGGGIVRVSPWPSLEFEPAWSPDGSKIAFTRGFEQGDVGNIWTIDLATGDPTRVTATPGYDHQVAWFADGSRLAFERVGTLITAKIVTVQPDGGDPDPLTSGHFDADPAPSPDGTSIVFASDRIGGFLPDLWTMGPDGSAPHVVVDLPFASTTPDWQPVL